MTKLHLGCGRTILSGWTNIDSQPLPGVDEVVNLEDGDGCLFRHADDSIDEFLMSHVLEHIKQPLPLMQELHRVAKPVAKLTIRVPYGSSDDAWEDPTHVRAYFLQSFGYFSQPFYWRADYGYRGDWSTESIELIVNSRYNDLAIRSPGFMAKELQTQRNVVEEMVATLVAVKPIRPPDRELQKSPVIRYMLRSAQPANIPLFDILEIETSSLCLRTCEDCIRNSHPNREALKPWLKQSYLSTEVIHRLLQEAKDMGFRGHVCLSHYNEPLLDKRIVTLGKYTKDMGCFSGVSICTNADNLGNAEALDGCFDELVISLYDEKLRAAREKKLRAAFKKTKLTFTGGVHIPTHFSPLHNVTQLAQQNLEKPCNEPQRRMIVNHLGEMLMCCDDCIGNFDLGNICDKSLKELWFSEKHQNLVRALCQPGGRRCHVYCMNCPRS